MYEFVDKDPVRVELLRAGFPAHRDADLRTGIGESTRPADPTAVYTFYRDASMLHRKVTVVGAYGTGSASDPYSEFREAAIRCDRQCTVVQLQFDAALSAEPPRIRRT